MTWATVGSSRVVPNFISVKMDCAWFHTGFFVGGRKPIIGNIVYGGSILPLRGSGNLGPLKLLLGPQKASSVSRQLSTGTYY